MTVTIESDPDYRAGKYVLFIDGKPSRMWVGAYVRSLRSSTREEFRANWPEVTDEMIAVMDAFDWPPQRNAGVEADMEVDLRCVCGELTPFYLDQDDPPTCETCGRGYRLEVNLSIRAGRSSPPTP